jgi:D-glycero-D-manno-heptose 1,7-bisphosphate phosphatase
LDRDGVVNQLTIDADHGTINSPLFPAQAEIVPGAPRALADLNKMGFGLAIATNQPAAAKGLTTMQNLRETHAKIVAAAESLGASVLSSHICFHRAEDGCSCRKPKTGLLAEAFARNPGFDRALSWMVGDGVTDVQAGKAFGIRAAFLGPYKCDVCRVFSDLSAHPDFTARSLPEFAAFLGAQLKP